MAEELMTRKTADRLGVGAGLLSIATVVTSAMYGEEAKPEYAFALFGGALILLMIALGLAITGSFSGVFVNQRNLMALSRVQAVLWSIVVLAAYAALVFARVHVGDADPLRVEVPGELLTIMGLSTASLLGSPVILRQKAGSAPDAKAVNRTALALSEKPEDIQANRVGTLYANPLPADAKFWDIFQGDEVGNTGHVDLAKLQMFCFTVVLILVYVWATWKALQNGEMDGLPALSEGMVAVLGISHAGYLGSKMGDHSESRPEPEKEPGSESVDVEPPAMG